MSLHIREVRTPAEKMEFIKLQWKFYRNDPYFVPPLLMDRKKLLNTEKNPFYKHAEIALFIADKNGEAQGRIAAITNENHNKVHGDNIGFFGFFECANDQEVADALFDAAAAWLKSKGKTAMRGPLNPSINDELGMLLEGFDDPPRIIMTYNPKYYLDLCDGYGLPKAMDLYAYKLETEKVLNEKLKRGQALVRQRFNVTLRDVDLKNLKSEINIIRKLYNESWEKNWGAVAATDEEFEALANDLKQVLGSKFQDFAIIAEMNGEPVGFVLVLPDINQILISNKKGRLIPAVWKLMTQTSKIKWARIITLGILPQYRGKGLDAVLYYEVVTRAAAKGIYFGEASWILEDNMMMNRGAALMNGTVYKKYRIYEKAL